MHEMRRVGEAAKWGTLILATAIVLLMIFYLATAHAEERIDCATIRARVAEHGKLVAYSWALANGYSPREIARIRKVCGL